MSQISNIFFFSLLFLSTSIAQRIIDESQYTQAYYDSIRITVSDTIEEKYVIQSFQLNKSDKITVDGRLTEAAWSQTARRGNWFEKEPYPLVPMSEPSEFAVMYDRENIYIGVWCWDSEPNKIVQQLNPRGSSSPDNIQIFLDPYYDKRTGYKFTVSPTGVQMDEMRYDDYKRDRNWNGVWYSAASLDDKGWYAEIKIPLFNLRFRDLPEQTWGFNIMRNISKDGSRGQWKPHLPEWELNTRMSTNGAIAGLKGLRPGRLFEFRPYAISGITQTAESPDSKKVGTGVDLRFSPTANITADLTLNPDFAQVDADVLVINLTRFPTRFQELRPFFMERTNIFNTPIELFYSRRIGSEGEVLGGAKLTGKSKSGFEFGALGCLVGDSPFSNLQSTLVHPEEALYGTVRIKQDLFNSSSIGLLAATKEENKNYNRVYGLDGSLVLSRNYLVNFNLANGLSTDVLLIPHQEFGKILNGSISAGKRKFDNWFADALFTLELLNEYSIAFNFNNYKKTELTGPYSGYFWHFRLLTRPPFKGARFYGSFEMNSCKYYNFNQKYVGICHRYLFTFQGRISKHIISKLQDEHAKTFTLQDVLDGRYWQFSSNTSFMFSKDLYFRLHFQGRFNTTFYGKKETKNEYLISTLLSWEYHPGCFFFLAYNEGRVDNLDRYLSDYFKFKDRTLVTKISYRFNL
jgi:hypothetical protein